MDNKLTLNKFTTLLPTAGIVLMIAGLFISVVLLQIAVYSMLLTFPFILQVKVKHKELKAFEILMILFFISGVIGLIMSKAPQKSVLNLTKYFFMLNTLPLCYFLQRDKKLNLKNIAYLVNIFATINAIYGFIHSFQGLDRTTSFYGGYFTLAVLMVFSLPISVSLFIHTTRKLKYYFLISVIIQFMALWFSYTRSAFLGIIIGSGLGGFIVLAYYWPKLNKVRLLAVFYLFLLPITLTILLFTSKTPRLNPTTIISPETLQDIDLTSGRKQIIEEAAQMLREDVKEGDWIHLTFGNGLYSRIMYFPDGIWGGWESDYLEALMSQGILGLFILVAVYYYLLKLSIKIIKINRSWEEYILQLGFIMSTIGLFCMSFLTHITLGFSSVVIISLLYAIMKGQLNNDGIK
jgi:O-antigen ligase